MAFDKKTYMREYMRRYREQGGAFGGFDTSSAQGYVNQAQKTVNNYGQQAMQAANNFISDVTNGNVSGINENTVNQAIDYANRILNDQSSSKELKAKAEEFLKNNSEQIRNFVYDNSPDLLKGILNKGAQSISDQYARERERIAKKVQGAADAYKEYHKIGRDTIKTGAKELTKKARGAASKAKNLVSKYPDYYKQGAKTIAKKARGAASSYVDAYRSGLSSIKKGASGIKKKARGAVNSYAGAYRSGLKTIGSGANKLRSKASSALSSYGSAYKSGVKTISNAASKAKKKVSGFIKRLGW